MVLKNEILQLLKKRNLTSSEMNKIGVAYHTVNGVNDNYTLAKNWYEKAINKNPPYPTAYRNLGLLYEEGYGVDKDFVKAAKYYQKALDEGYHKAKEDLDDLLKSSDISATDMNKIGVMYHKGLQVKKNCVEARKWYEKAIDKNPPCLTAYLNLGLLYEEGRKVKKNFVKAAKYYQQALDKGHNNGQKSLDRLMTSPDISAEDMNGIGMLYHKGKDVEINYILAKTWYEKAINKNPLDPTAYRNLGLIYEQRDDVDRDFVKAAKYYQKALDKGHNDSQEDLDCLMESHDINAEDMNGIGVLYHNGEDVKKDYILAKTWYGKAIEKHDPMAYRNLGVLYENGDGVDKDFVKAAKYYQQAVDKGYEDEEKDLDRLMKSQDISAEDMSRIGMLYHSGIKINQDYNLAKTWYDCAIKKQTHSPLAHRGLGLLYEYGHGVENNPGTAHSHYNKIVSISLTHPILSINTKKIIIEQFLLELEPLKASLLTAVLDGGRYKFPSGFEKLTRLQEVYHDHNDPDIQESLQAAIEQYLKTDGFTKLLTSTNPAKWNSKLLIFLADKLKISIEENILVECLIEKGKINWRIIKGNTEMIPCKSAIDFQNEHVRRMTWEQFLLIKTSGKRSGRVVFTEDKFIGFFDVSKQDKAREVFQELKSKNILNDKGRLSAEWRSLSNKKIQLDSITPISLTEFHTVLKKLKETMRQPMPQPVSFTKEIFCSTWNNKQKNQAEIVWANMIEKGLVKNNKVFYSEIIKINPQEQINNLKKKSLLSHNEIIDVLNKIATEGVPKKISPKLTDLKLDLRERTLKNWANTGLITNKDPKNETHCTKILDVGIYKDLRAHSNTDNGLNCDHIPPSNVLNEISTNENLQETKDNWWTIAIPKNLHKLTPGYAEQDNKITLSASIFLDHVSVYLDYLEKNPQGDLPNYLAMLGAFRYLYRCQVKEHTHIGKATRIGKAPHTFFNSPGYQDKIDTFFHERIAKHMEETEGVKFNP